MQQLFEFLISHLMHPIAALYTAAAAVAKRGYPGITGQLLTRDLSTEVTRAADQIGSYDRTYTRHTEQQIIVLLNGCIFPDHLLDLLVHFVKGLFYSL